MTTYISNKIKLREKWDLSKNKMKIWNLEARPDLAHIRLLINNASPIRVSPSPLLARRALEGKVSPWMHLGPTSLRFTEDTVVISPAYPFQSHLANTNSILDYAASSVFCFICRRFCSFGSRNLNFFISGSCFFVLLICSWVYEILLAYYLIWVKSFMLISP